MSTELAGAGGASAKDEYLDLYSDQEEELLPDQDGR